MPTPSYGRGVLVCDRRRPQAAEGADEHSPSTPRFPVYNNFTYNRLCLFSRSPPTPPLDFSHRLTLTFFLECIATTATIELASWRISPIPRSRPLETGLGAPLWALRVFCGRWHDRGVADDFA